MTPIDLADYTLAELKGLLYEVGIAIGERERERVAAAREHAQAIARAAGISLDDLAGGGAPLPRQRG
jgi:phosphoglycolate phosphatase-like HAD superfamily hydrolase